MERNEKLVECMECHCSGILRCKKGKTILVPNNSESVRLYDEVGNFGLPTHGFDTFKQKISAVAGGTLFWMTIILVANYAGLEDIRTKYTFKTLNCGKNLKQCLLEFPYNECYSAFSTCMRENTDFIFPEKMAIIQNEIQIPSDHFTDEEQNVNLKKCKRLNFYDLQICKGLCSKTHENDQIICIDLCRSLMSDEGETKKICPFEKRCPLGCPCPFYVCEHVDPNKFPLVWYHNETDPMFELKKGVKENFTPVRPNDDSVSEILPAVKMRRHLSRLATFDLRVKKKLSVYERIVFVRINANIQAMLNSLKYPKRHFDDYVQFLSTSSFVSMSSLYFQGKNYLFNNEINVFVMENDSNEVTDLDVNTALFLSRYGYTNFFSFDGFASILAVHEDLFYFCSSYKHYDYCFFIDPLKKGRKEIYEAKGRLPAKSSLHRKNAFVSNNQLHIMEIDRMAIVVRLYSMQHRDKDWSTLAYEDQSWERDFKNETFKYDDPIMDLFQTPFDTEILDFYPVPDRKGVLFIGTFRRREFKLVRQPCPFLCPLTRVFTKAEYFFIIYRYVYGRFIKIGQMETNYRYGDAEYGYNLQKPFYKDIFAFEDDGDIIVGANSEKNPSRLVLDFEGDQNYLEEFELPAGIEFMTASN